jgi:hypothetical protein
MSKPLPWSFSALDTFKTCPRMYQAKYVLKSVKEPPSPQMLEGTRVHAAFEDRQAVGTPLPADLAAHEDFMAQLDDRPGVAFTESKFGFDLKGKPCNFFDREVWCRGVKDFEKVDGDTALSIDYKTGKQHQKFEQLALAAIHTFQMFPAVRLVNAQFYWTQTKTVTKKVWGRDDIPGLWGHFIPDLRQYKQAFEQNIWQPRQSGLCKKHCAVLECEFNGRSAL